MSLQPVQSSLKIFPLRLRPNMEIVSTLSDFVKQNNLKAAFILTCCGSVRGATLRYATSANGKESEETLNGCFEITSLVGTICKDGSHLHVTLGDTCGKTLSGHVIGNLIVQTTAEIVLGEASDAIFSRQFDTSTNFNELVVQPYP